MPQIEQRAGVAGGCPIYSFISAGAVQAATIKTSVGQVLALHFFNNSNTICYVRLYDQTTVPGPADSPIYRGMVPANTSGAGYVVGIPPGTPFLTGISLRVTAGITDADNTPVPANAVLGNIFYK